MSNTPKSVIIREASMKRIDNEKAELHISAVAIDNESDAMPGIECAVMVNSGRVASCISGPDGMIDFQHVVTIPVQETISLCLEEVSQGVQSRVRILLGSEDAEKLHNLQYKPGDVAVLFTKEKGTFLWIYIKGIEICRNPGYTVEFKEHKNGKLIRQSYHDFMHLDHSSRKCFFPNREDKNMREYHGNNIQSYPAGKGAEEHVAQIIKQCEAESQESLRRDWLRGQYNYFKTQMACLSGKSEERDVGLLLAGAGEFYEKYKNELLIDERGFFEFEIFEIHKKALQAIRALEEKLHNEREKSRADELRTKTIHAKQQIDTAVSSLPSELPQGLKVPCAPYEKSQFDQQLQKMKDIKSRFASVVREFSQEGVTATDLSALFPTFDLTALEERINEMERAYISRLSDYEKGMVARENEAKRSEEAQANQIKRYVEINNCIDRIKEDPQWVIRELTRIDISKDDFSLPCYYGGKKNDKLIGNSIVNYYLSELYGKDFRDLKRKSHKYGNVHYYEAHYNGLIELMGFLKKREFDINRWCKNNYTDFQQRLKERLMEREKLQGKDMILWTSRDCKFQRAYVDLQIGACRKIIDLI